MPGGLNVKEGERINDGLLKYQNFDDLESWMHAVKASSNSFQAITKWIGCFAMAVQEQNASFNRVVTSPTNGAAGVYSVCYHVLLKFL